MVYVDYTPLPTADPVSGFVLHCGDLAFGVQDMKLPEGTGADATCDLTLEPLVDLPRVGSLVWARKSDDQAAQWRFLCLPEDSDGSAGKVHVFDFDIIKGYLESEGEFTTCPICKRGSIRKAPKVDQIEVSFTSDLFLTRDEFIKTGDSGMALFYEQKIIEQIIKNDEKEFESQAVLILKKWYQNVLITSLDAAITTCVQHDRAHYLKHILSLHPELATTSRLGAALEEACKLESGDIVLLLIKDFKPPVTFACFSSLVKYRNEFLSDELIEYYAEWSKTAESLNLIGGADWDQLGRDSILAGFPSFVRNVQVHGVFRLHSRMKNDAKVDQRRLVELGLLLRPSEDHHEDVSEEEDSWGGADDSWGDPDNSDQGMFSE